jgi:hypothetical protein
MCILLAYPRLRRGLESGRRYRGCIASAPLGAKNGLPKYFRLFLLLGLVCGTGVMEQLDSTQGGLGLVPTNPDPAETTDRRSPPLDSARETFDQASRRGPPTRAQLWI